MSCTWKVIIADDEYIIRQGIRSCVPWEQFGMTVAGEAEDGEEALELAVREKANIMLVDLSMPIMGGLPLIRHIREQLPECKIIIITGHDEFSYAQEAIRLEVDGYILKPVNANQLRELLEKIMMKLEGAADADETMRLAARQLERSFTLLRERFLNEWIGGELSHDEAAEQLSFLRFPKEAPNWLGAIRWPEQTMGKAFISEKDRQLLLFAIENIVKELLGKYETALFRDHAGVIIIMLWSGGEGGSGSDVELLLDSHIIERTIHRYLKINIINSWQTVRGGLDTVSEAYLAAKEELGRESKMSPYVRKVKELIEKEYGNPGLTLESAASSLNISPVYLSRIFKQETGQPFISMLTQIRMKAAVRLLSSTDFPINEIAEQVGYESQHYFSTAFKKTVGIPPLQFRKSGSQG